MASMNFLWDGSRASVEPNGAVKHRPIGANPFTTQAPPADIDPNSVPAQAVVQAVKLHNELALAVNDAVSNVNLSDDGRRNALEAPIRNALERLANLALALKADRQATNKREAQMYAVPAVAPGDVATATADAYIWGYFAQRSPDEQADMLSRAFQDLARGERFLVAMQRNPLPLLDPQIALITETWQRHRREAMVTEAEAIDAQRAAQEWAFRQLALVASLTAQLGKTWGRADALTTLLKARPDLPYEGAEIFGYSRRDVATKARGLNAEVIAAS